MSATDADIINIECCIVKKIDCKYVLYLQLVGRTNRRIHARRVPGVPISQIRRLASPGVKPLRLSGRAAQCWPVIFCKLGCWPFLGTPVGDDAAIESI